MKKPYLESEVEDLKARFPNLIKEIQVYPSGTNFDKDGNADEDPVCYIIKKPSKSLLHLINSPEFKNDTEKANNAIIANCVLLGDKERIEEDASIFSGVIDTLAGLIGSSRVELKNV